MTGNTMTEVKANALCEKIKSTRKYFLEARVVIDTVLSPGGYNVSLVTNGFTNYETKDLIKLAGRNHWMIVSNSYKVEFCIY